MAEAFVLASDDGAVRTLTLNRPQALNSFTGEMHRQLRVALEAAADTRSVRCVVITGAGRGFCAGQDLADPAMATPAGAAAPEVSRVLEDHYIPLAHRLREMPVPVVAAVNGVAAGAGASLALSCDIAIATRSASFIQAFSKIGLVPDFGGTWLLPHLAGRAKAIGLAMTGDKLPAADAERLGLIYACVDDAEFAEATRNLTQRLAAMPTRALVETRHAIDRAIEVDYPTALEHEARVQGQLGQAADFAEGVAAFFAKRPPRFTDR